MVMVFTGGWLDGMRHGHGMQQCSEGSNFVGDYVCGNREGVGAYTFPNGDRQAFFNQSTFVDSECRTSTS